MSIALAIVVGAFVLLNVIPLVFIEWHTHMTQREADEAIANFSKLREPELKKEHELKAVDIEQRVKIRKMKKAIKFVPKITLDEKAEAELVLGSEEIGTDDGGHSIVSIPDSIEPSSDSADIDDPLVASQYPSPVEVVEEMPQFPGGLKALMVWLDKNIVYPPICVRNKVQGRVEVSFYVDSAGNVREPKITKSLHPLLDQEALLTVRRMPRWTPGKSHGKFTTVRVTIPIVFAL